jgi:hypothetical protein
MYKMKVCAENAVVPGRPGNELPQNRSNKTLTQECKLLATRSCDVFLDGYHANDAEKEGNKTVTGRQEFARKESRECDLEWVGYIQFLKGDIAEQASGTTNNSHEF